jgi:hypothetical protein
LCAAFARSLFALCLSRQGRQTCCEQAIAGFASASTGFASAGLLNIVADRSKVSQVSLMRSNV